MSHARLQTPAGTGYQPEYDLAPTPWEKGRIGEYQAVDIIDRLKHGSVEVKRDLRAKDRLFVETGCQWGDGEWHPSGILDPESRADQWMFVLAEGFAVVVAADALRALAVRVLNSGQRAGFGWGIVEKPAGPRDEYATRGVVFPLESLASWVRSIEKTIAQDAA